MNTNSDDIIFNISRATPDKTAHGTAVLDMEEDGNILRIEVYGLSYLIGRAPEDEEIAWVKSEVIDAFFSPEDDVLSILVGYGENRWQRSLPAVFGLSDAGELVSLSISQE